MKESWLPLLIEIQDHLSALVKASGVYAAQVEQEFDEEKARGVATARTLQVWEWQVDAAKDFYAMLEDDVLDLLMRIMEQDYVLRRDDVNDILV